jgi:hypothetical protein
VFGFLWSFEWSLSGYDRGEHLVLLAPLGVVTTDGNRLVRLDRPMSNRAPRLRSCCCDQTAGECLGREPRVASVGIGRYRVRRDLIVNASERSDIQQLAIGWRQAVNRTTYSRSGSMSHALYGTRTTSSASERPNRTPQTLYASPIAFTDPKIMCPLTADWSLS